LRLFVRHRMQRGIIGSKPLLKGMVQSL
jgi:hypothetical protein